MALLPQKVGTLTLVRALENDGVCQSYLGILDGAVGTQVIVRQLLPALARSRDIREAVTARIGDLLPLRHPSLQPLTQTFEHDGGLYLTHEWTDTVSVAALVEWCRENNEALPLNIFLHIAVQICNALEGLHGRSGEVTKAPQVLHLRVRPSSILLSREGSVLVGDYGLLPGPTFATQTGGFHLKTAYMSPEQTHAEARQALAEEDESEGSLRHLSPASDLFSLGAVLYELLVHKPMFEAGTPLRTIAKVRRAEVTTQLLEVKEVFPGVDRVLYRAMALNPRHRYQRAFVLREDLRGLMAEFSFSNIDEECRRFLAPLFRGDRKAVNELLPPRPAPPMSVPDTEPTVLAKIDVEAIRRGLSIPPFETEFETEDALPDDVEEDDDSPYRGDSAPTGAFDFPSSPGPVVAPVHYAADGPDAQWSDVQPLVAGTAAIRAFDDLPPTEEIASTEENDLLPVDVPLQSLPESDSYPAHPKTAPLLEVTSTEAGVSPVSLALGVGVASMVAAALTLCAGGLVLGALASRAPNIEDTTIEPALGRPAFRPTGVRAWRSVPSLRATPTPKLSPLVPGSVLAAAVAAMDDGDYRKTLDLLEGLPTPNDLDDALLLHELRGSAHRALFERSSPPDPAHIRAANRAWLLYRKLAKGQPGLVDRADAHLTHLATLQR